MAVRLSLAKGRRIPVGIETGHGKPQRSFLFNPVSLAEIVDGPSLAFRQSLQVFLYLLPFPRLWEDQISDRNPLIQQI